MAIPSRGIKWQIQFKSLKGYDCYVNIYLEGYTGTPSQLKGAEVPVYFEEDDSQNLLKNIRYKTGYISFYEETYGEWSDVFPSTNLDRYVEVLYNSQLMFRGFLQAQTFENDWEPGPRLINIPIVSVIGVTQSIYFDPTALGNDTLTTWAVLWHVGNEMTVPFSYVIFPDTEGTDSKGNTIPRITFGEKLRTLHICPYNDQYDRAEHSTAPTELYSPCSLYQFLEGLCNAYGWILHEWEDCFVFTKHDHTGDYLKKEMDDIEWDESYTTITPSALDLSDYINISSNRNTISSIMPVSRIEMNFGTKRIENGEMNFERCAAYIRYWNSNGRLYYFLTPMSNEFSGSLLQVMDDIEWSPSNQRLLNDGCYITFASQNDGNNDSDWEEIGKGILVQWSTGWAANTNLFQVRLPYPATSPDVKVLSPSGSIPANNVYKIELELAWGKSYTSPYLDEYFRSDGHDDFTIDVAICNQEGKYLDALGYWSDNVIFRTLTIDGTNGLIKKTRATRHLDEFRLLEDIQADSLFFVFRTDTNNNIRDHEPIFFKKIGWDMASERFFPELYERPVDRHFDASNGSNKTASIDQFLTPYRYSENLIGDDVVDAMFTEYPYMFTAQNELKIDSRHDLPSDFYLRPYTYDGRNDWKILAITFSPRNDEYQLTLHTF